MANTYDQCVKRFKLSDISDDIEFFTLNQEKLIGSESAPWQSYLEYQINFGQLELHNDIFSGIFEGIDLESTHDPLSFFGVKLLIDQEYWSQIN